MRPIDSRSWWFRSNVVHDPIDSFDLEGRTIQSSHPLIARHRTGYSPRLLFATRSS